jgi:hypothetical protein
MREPLDWDMFISRTVHPIRVAALEAMRWIDEPFSATDLNSMFEGDPPGIEAIAYHLRVLASDLPMLQVYEEETVRGSTRKLYFFRDRTPISRRRKRAA